MIRLENVTCSYDKDILKNINLNIKQDKITFIIGKNGSGKSTLASVLTGINKKFKGKIYIDDILINKKTSIKTLRSLIGLVFQNPDNQIIFNRVYDDLKFTLENMGISTSDIDDIIKESLKKVNMEDEINANPYKLSGGQKQRIAIASILALKPKYIIFDEATSMLDINGKKDIYEMIQKLKQNNIGVIFITNNLDELLYADDIIIIDNQKIYSYSKKDIFDNLNILKDHNFEIPFTLKIIDILNKKKIKVKTEKGILEELEKL